LTYLAGESGAESYSKDGIIHAYSSADVIAAYKEATDNDTVSVFFESKKIQEQPVDEGYGEIKQAYVENADLYLLNETSLEECMEKFINQRNSILNK
ncbi:MAG: sugar ABC transporter substrate-binding protein, partial [Eubacterium sp.]|nr:sugar ABC transporter substrate-binding protein [Eubacterium sp.]